MIVEITLEKGNVCAYCGEELNADLEITIRDNKIYHTCCLEENLR